jgi:polyhydroxyalkanoate synthesis repressor PhaR
MAAPFVVKKYGNRRLYDTEESRYVTLEELAEKVRDGSDVRVVDAKTGEDLTQPTLTQIILESRGAAKRLPVPLLVQLIRMDDDALAEFLGRWVSGALEMYVQAKHGAQAIAPYVPMATAPFTATNALARMMLGAGNFFAPAWQAPGPPMAAPPVAAPPEPPPSDVDALRRELAELKRSLQRNERSPRKRPRG